MAQKLDGRFLDRLGKNKIINGCFRVNQRGTSFTTPNGVYTLDRWIVDTAESGGAATVTRESSPASEKSEASNYLKIDQTVARGALLNRTLQQRVEGDENGIHVHSGKTFTVSFEAKGTVGKAFTVDLQQVLLSATSLDNAFPDTLTLTSDWARYESTVTLQDSTAATSTADDFLRLGFVEDVAGIFELNIRNVQLEEGPTATDFEQRPLTIEEQLCKRYFQWSRVWMAAGSDSSGSAVQHMYHTEVSMRTSVATISKVGTFGVSNINTWSVFMLNKNMWYMNITLVASGAWQLTDNSGTGWIEIDDEL